MLVFLPFYFVFGCISVEVRNVNAHYQQDMTMALGHQVMIIVLVICYKSLAIR